MHTDHMETTRCPTTSATSDEELHFLMSRLRTDVAAVAALHALTVEGRWAEVPAALREYLRRRADPRLFFDAAAVPSLLETIARVDPQSFATTRRIADHALRWEFPNSTNASIERFVPLSPEYDFVANPTEDSEFARAMNRLRWMPALASLHRATGEARYLDFLLAFWRLYVARVGYPQRADFDSAADTWHGHLPAPWHRLDHFIRLTNLWWTFWLLLHAPDVRPDDFAWMLAQLIRQHDVVLAHGPSDLRQNHAAMQYESLYLTATLLPEFHAMEASALAARIALEESFMLAFFEDGLHYEQSPDYGQSCLQWYGQSLLLAERNGECWMRYFRDRLRLAFEAYDRIATPAGTCPVIGDSDPSPVAPFLTLGRALFPDLALTRRLTPGAAHVWYGVREDDAAPTAPAPRLQLFPHAGFAVVRDAGAYLTFDCGTKGEWHGHADLLHVHYWLGEEMILGDGGRWLYNGDAFRHWALSPRAHNTVAVDGRAMAALEDPAHPALGPIHAHEADGIMRLHAWHDAFSLPDEPVRCRRFLAVDPLVGWLLVVDELTAAAPQSWQQYWLFPREDVTLNDTGVAIGTTARMLLHGGRRTLRSQDWSPSYSVRAPGRQLTVSLRQSSAVLAMLLLPWKIDGALTVDDSPSQWTVDVTAGAFHARLSATDWNETTGSSRKRNA